MDERTKEESMKLRYLTTQIKVEPHEWKQYSIDNQVSQLEAKRILEARSPTMLQYWDGHKEEWITVPFIVEYR